MSLHVFFGKVPKRETRLIFMSDTQKDMKNAQIWITKRPIAVEFGIFLVLTWNSEGL